MCSSCLFKLPRVCLFRSNNSRSPLSTLSEILHRAVRCLSFPPCSFAAPSSHKVALPHRTFCWGTFSLSYIILHISVQMHPVPCCKGNARMHLQIHFLHFLLHSSFFSRMLRRVHTLFQRPCACFELIWCILKYNLPQSK